jgi:hypothetical protein
MTIFGACTVNALQMRNYTANSPIQTTVTLVKNGTATSLSCSTATGGGTSCTDTTAGHEFRSLLTTRFRYG